MALKTYTGSCHCGAVRYEADLDLDEGSNRCNCSCCAKARAWFAFAKGPERFRLLEGADHVSDYRWVAPGQTEPHLTFSFCKTCGIRTYAGGELAHLGGVFHAISVPTLEIPLEQLATFPVHYIDGRKGDYGEVSRFTAAL